MKNLAQVLGFLAVFFTSSALTSARAEPSALPSPTFESLLDAEELAFLDLINAYRTSHSLVPLEPDEAFNEAAQWLASDMAEKNYLSHTDSLGRAPADRLKDFLPEHAPLGWWAENIAAGHGDAAATFEQWRHSPGHNQNMLNPKHRKIGIGRAANAASNYRHYWATDFRD